MVEKDLHVVWALVAQTHGAMLLCRSKEADGGRETAESGFRM